MSPFSSCSDDLDCRKVLAITDSETVHEVAPYLQPRYLAQTCHLFLCAASVHAALSPGEEEYFRTIAEQLVAEPYTSEPENESIES